MLTQSIAAISSSPSPSLFSSKSFRSQTQLGFLNPEVIRTNRNISISCSSSVQAGNSVVSNKEWKLGSEVKDLISLGSASFFNKCAKEGKQLTQQELQACALLTKKLHKYNLALEVYEWMKNQGDRFKMSSLDIAMQLDLIYKVHGISSAEEYFLKLPDSSKDNLSYGALLNAYVQSKMREKAESLFEEIRDRGYATCSLPFNSKMALYMKVKEYEKVMPLIAEMLEKKIKLDLSSYSIWITASGALGSLEKTEEVVKQMKLDSHIDLDWNIYSTMATVYIKLGEKEKAKVCLKEVENRITASDQKPYKCLLTLYAFIGQKEDVYRIWSTFKSSFPKSLGLVGEALTESMILLNDAEFTEKILKESNDPTILNFLICQYASKGKPGLGLARVYANREEGQVYSQTWEFLALKYFVGGPEQWSACFSCLKKAATTALRAKTWRLNPKFLSAMLSALSASTKLAIKTEDDLLNFLRE